MASHFSSIGITVTNREEFIEYLKKSYEHGEKIKTNRGTYLKWELGNGVELWGQLDSSGNPIGLNPYFKGKSRTSVRIDDIVYRENDTILDGAFSGWVSPDNDAKGGIYPFVIDTPNMAMYDNIKVPQILEFQITAFAHEIKAYANDEEFNASQEGEPKFASESFIPSGLFSPDGKSTNPPEALAIFNGHIVHVKELTNPVINDKFLWTLVRTLGAEYDVIIDPQILERELITGGVISGSFWLTGVIVKGFIKKEKSLFKKLFNKSN